MTQLIWLGQKIEYDADKNVISLEIREPFWKASEMLNWPEKSSGIGINPKIIDFLQARHADLMIYVRSEKGWWIAPFIGIEDFLSYHETVWHVRNGKFKLRIISWDIFKWCEGPNP